MQLAWLEQLTKEGHVSPRARAAIYRDCSQILKVAETKAQAMARAEKNIGAFMDKHQGKIEAATAALAAFVGSRLLGRWQGNKEMANIQKSVASVRQAVANNPEFATYREKAEARFNELVKIAPTVAQNPELTLRIIKEKIHSGFTAQDVQHLALIQASYTPNMGAQMRLSERVKTAAAERVGETLATQFALCKEAGLSWKTMGRAAENALVLSAIPVLGGVGVGAVKQITGMRDKKKMQERLTASFEQALKLSDPDKDGLHENKELARQAFQVLAHFSPHVALEPNAAKGFMKKLVSWSGQGPQVEDIKNLSEIERNYRSTSKGSPFFEGLAAGSKALGLDGALKATTSSLSRPLNAEVADMAADDLELPRGWQKGGQD